MKIRRYIPYKNITFCCRDCGTRISYGPALFGKGRCHSCANKTRKLSQETKLKISKANTGRIVSDEARKKISKANKGKKVSLQTREKMSKAMLGKNKGKKLSKEHREKIRLAGIGRKHSKETRLKISKAQKGKKHHFFGKHHSKKTLLLISQRLKGRKLSKEHIKKISGKNHPMFGVHRFGKHAPNFGKKHSKETKLKMSKIKKGKHHSKKSRLKMSETRKGKNNGNWLGGISFLPYTQDFSKDLKLKIRCRDNHICQGCGMTEKEHGKNLAIHHIDYNKFNCQKTNLITTCISCNSKANSNRDYWFAYYTYIIKHFKEHVATF